MRKGNLYARSGLADLQKGLLILACGFEKVARVMLLCFVQVLPLTCMNELL
jgi:hypothetical protein